MVALADRWHKLPEEIEAMDARYLRMVNIVDRAHPKGEVN